MATNKAKSSSKTAKAATPAPSKSTTKVTTVTKNTSSAKIQRVHFVKDNVANIVIAELIGTFILTIVALLTIQSVMPLFVGLTLTLLVLAIGGASGSHVNPAVTFGLWSVKKVKTLLVPIYWASQLLGAIAALVVTHQLSGKSLNLDFSSFGTFTWGMFWVELLGTAVFLFGLTAVIHHKELKPAGKALGVGLSLFVGILIATSAFSSVQSSIDTSNIKPELDEKTGQQVYKDIPHELNVKGATLNPAVAFASSEYSLSERNNGMVKPAKDEKRTSRFSVEVILGTLFGALIGAQLFRLVGYKFE